MRAARGVALALAALLFGCPPDKPPQNPKDAAKVSDAELPKDVDGLVKYADEQYGRHEQGAVFNAIKALEKAVELDAKSFEALWRLARPPSVSRFFLLVRCALPTSPLSRPPAT